MCPPRLAHHIISLHYVLIHRVLINSHLRGCQWTKHTTDHGLLTLDAGLKSTPQSFFSNISMDNVSLWGIYRGRFCLLTTKISLLMLDHKYDLSISIIVGICCSCSKRFVFKFFSDSDSETQYEHPHHFTTTCPHRKQEIWHEISLWKVSYRSLCGCVRARRHGEKSNLGKWHDTLKHNSKFYTIYSTIMSLMPYILYVWIKDKLDLRHNK